MRILVPVSFATLSFAFGVIANAAPNEAVTTGVERVEYSTSQPGDSVAGKRRADDYCMYDAQSAQKPGGKKVGSGAGSAVEVGETNWVCGGGSGGSSVGVGGGATFSGGSGGMSGGGGGGSGGGSAASTGEDSGSSKNGGRNYADGKPGVGYKGGSGGGSGGGNGSRVSRSAPSPILGVGLPALIIAGGYVFFLRKAKANKR